MPLLNQQDINSDLSIAIWHIDESLEDLLNQVILNEKEKERLHHFPSIKRKKEWLATRLMLQTIQPSNCKIAYHSNGKPYLIDSDIQLSISHSNPFVGIALNKSQPTGIDIQVVKPNILKGKSLFLQLQDLQNLGTKSSNPHHLHLAWCAKEAMYKFIGNNTLNIYEHFTIKLITGNEQEGEIKGFCQFTETPILMRFQKQDGFYLVFTV